jgi:hypothetical protein
LKERRGGGYWIWKIDIFKQALSHMEEGDFLVYMDAGCELNNKGKERFKEYISILKDSKYGVLSFKLSYHPEREWTIKEIFEHFEISIGGEEALDGQLLSTVWVMKKCKHLYKILEEFENVLINKPDYFTDKYNRNQNKYFKDNRHDQSVASIVKKLYGTVVIPTDETYFKDFNSEEASRFPFWAKRKKD